MEWSSLKVGTFIDKKPSRAASSDQPPARTSSSASESWHWSVKGPAEDVEIIDGDPQDDMDCGSPLAETDPYQSIDTNPRTANKTKVGFNQGEKAATFQSGADDRDG